MGSVILRPLFATETGLLERATLGNINWCGQRFTMDDVRRTPEFAHYTRPDPLRGDFGIVAERDEEALGVVWALFLPADHPGFGFVDEATPELSLWVDEAERRKGIGRSLMGAALTEARERGAAQISLSVEEGNFSKDLYTSFGFTDVPGLEANGVMLLRL